MNIQKSVQDIEELEEKLLKCQTNLRNINKEIEILLSEHKDKFSNKEEEKKEKKEKKKKKKRSKKSKSK